ncbi:MAG: phosphomannomutase [Silicimonas sp.]|nr:phosphomannomutase [Silicimonas sp.]
MMPEFGTSGLRGLAVELTDDLVGRYAAAFVALHGTGGPIFIGQDKRDSSPRMAAAVARGAAEEGVAVVDCGVLPTPALALAAQNAGTIAIMITGSHIPADRNGLKFYTLSGEFTKADEGPLAQAVAERAAPSGPLPEVQAEPEAREAYIARYTSGFPPNALRGARVGVWMHSSAATEVLPAILSALGADVVPLGVSGAFVSVDTEAVDADTRATLANWVKSEDLDALVSTDGDADRPLLVDDQGRVVPGDILGPITAAWCGAKGVVTTVSANTLVDLIGTFEVSRTKIGSPYVIAEMENRGAGFVGYEPNGGFLLGWDLDDSEKRLGKLMTRDAMLPLLAVITASRGAGSISAMLENYPERRTATDRLKDIPREKSLTLVDALLNGDLSVLPDGLGALVATNTTDGARLSFETGRVVHIRPSGNAPELRCYVEAESDVAAAEVLSVAMDKLRHALM